MRRDYGHSGSTRAWTADAAGPAGAGLPAGRWWLTGRRGKSRFDLTGVGRDDGPKLAIVASRRLTDFEQVLIGLVCAAPSTGYDLKHEFATTPLGVYQPSSGAIYPALRRLERGGLLRAQQGPPPDTNGAPGRARRRVIYSITDQGRAAHAAWVRQPVNPATVATDLPLHLMRFVMMERLLTRAEVLRFLAELRDALAALLDGLESYTATAATDMPGRHAALALDHGVSERVASLAWVKRTINALAGPEPGLSPGLQRPSRPAETSHPAAPSR
jgi:DNA-binding PadR family transcriptional regulator